VFDGGDKRRSGARNEFGGLDVPIRPALRWTLLPEGSVRCSPPGSCPRGHRVPESGTFSWNTSLRLHELVCGACRADGHDDHAWAMVDPAYEQIEPDQATGAGFELVAVAPAGALVAGGRIELRLDGPAVGDASLFVCTADRFGMLELVRVAPGHRRRGYGRLLALAALSRCDWSIEQPRWVRGDLRGRALAAVRRGAGYVWTTAQVPDTDEARAFARALPVSAAGGPQYCNHQCERGGFAGHDGGDAESRRS
jgi:GNAT superfamily N-acetyltransferase